MLLVTIFMWNIRIFLLLSLQPQSFKEAMQDAGWHNAMGKEIRALENNGT